MQVTNKKRKTESILEELDHDPSSVGRITTPVNKNLGDLLKNLLDFETGEERDLISANITLKNSEYFLKYLFFKYTTPNFKENLTKIDLEDIHQGFKIF